MELVDHVGVGCASQWRCDALVEAETGPSQQLHGAHGGAHLLEEGAALDAGPDVVDAGCEARAWMRANGRLEANQDWVERNAPYRAT
eukprot:8814054-Pyramimonas_sp.AAC.1